jgi:hypothetical protein
MLNQTTVTVKCVGHDTASESLQDLMRIFFPVAEGLEEELRSRQGMGALFLDDQVLWELELEGSKWDYVAHGEVSHLRDGTVMEYRRARIHGGKLVWGE